VKKSVARRQLDLGLRQVPSLGWWELKVA
jgi:hypothetical protein